MPNHVTNKQISTLRIEFAVLWSDNRWSDCHFEEYEVDMANQNDIELGVPTLTYLDKMCQEYEKSLSSANVVKKSSVDIVKVVVYQWHWKDEDSV